MGRTARRRRRKKESHDVFGVNFLSFQKWIISQGWRQTKKMKLKDFPETGRGLMSMENISSGDTLVKIPPNLLITSSKVAKSAIGEIFVKKDVKVPVHLVLATFIMYEKHCELRSYWKEYISVLPSSFNSPLFCSFDELDIFPKFILDQVLSVRNIVKNMYDTLLTLCGSSNCHYCNTPLSAIFSYESFLWSWFVVNSRVVYVSPLKNEKHAIALSDSDSLALAPYLDMLNHSNSSRVLALFDSESGYELKTLVPIKKYQQVYIHYGNHDNLKLFLDYGFVLPQNDHDVFPLSVTDFTFAMKDYLSIKQKLNLIRENCPDYLKGLYCCGDGFSWNSKVLIYLLSSNQNSNLKNALKQVYQDTFEEICVPLSAICKSIVTLKIKEIADAVQKIALFKNNDTLSTCKEMLKSYLSILETCLSNL